LIDGCCEGFNVGYKLGCSVGSSVGIGDGSPSLVQFDSPVAWVKKPDVQLLQPTMPPSRANVPIAQGVQLDDPLDLLK